MKQILPLLVLPLVALVSACSTQGAHGNDHWSQRSISNSMGRAFIGYDEARDGDYEGHVYESRKSISATIRRHFFNHNPENPFQAYDASYFEPRHKYTVNPDTMTYSSSAATKSASYLRSSIGIGATGEAAAR